MLQYHPGESIAHRLDPRSKLAFQFGFALFAFASTDPRWLAAAFVIGVCCLWVGGLSLRRALQAYWLVLVLFGAVILLAGITVGSPWFQIERARDSALAVGRVIPILLVSAAFVHTTPIRETRAAIQRTVPGKFGQLLGVGVGLTFRFLPVIRRDVTTIREALQARGGDRRPLHDRAGRLALLSTERALSRADTLSVALQARCFAWNPTLPTLRFHRVDYAVLLTAAVLALLAVVHSLSFLF